MSNQNKNSKILVVDDVPQNIRLLEANLKADGYNVISANNGQEALEKVATDKPDLILLDIMMPIMDGNEVCRRIRTNNNTRWIPIVMVTAFESGPEKIAQSLDDGADDFIKKPFDRYELLARVRSLLRVKGLQDELIYINKRLEDELVLAKDVQQALLPQEFPDIPDLDFSHRYIPSLIVGGDFFDIEEISPSTVTVFICDVMGHGPQAAMITGIVKALLAQLVHYYPNPDALLTHMNNRFHEIMSSSSLLIFITAFCIVINTQNGTAFYANAGHPPPFLVKTRNSTLEELSGEHGFALGMIPNASYHNNSLVIENGDMMFMFTDGLLEIMNEKRVQFGAEEFQRAIKNNSNLSPQAFVEAMLSAADAFSGGLYTDDDVTLLAFRYNHTGAD
jgi:sigma-B regulation protein RsbU (phosphoserine phosphatase)